MGPLPVNDHTFIRTSLRGMGARNSPDAHASVNRQGAGQVRTGPLAPGRGRAGRPARCRHTARRSRSPAARPSSGRSAAGWRAGRGKDPFEGGTGRGWVLAPLGLRASRHFSRPRASSALAPGPPPPLPSTSQGACHAQKNCTQSRRVDRQALPSLHAGESASLSFSLPLQSRPAERLGRYTDGGPE